MTVYDIRTGKERDVGEDEMIERYLDRMRIERAQDEGEAIVWGIFKLMAVVTIVVVLLHWLGWLPPAP